VGGFLFSFEFLILDLEFVDDFKHGSHLLLGHHDKRTVISVSLGLCHMCIFDLLLKVVESFMLHAG